MLPSGNGWFRRTVLLFVVVLCGTAGLYAEQRSGSIYWAPENATVTGHEVDRLLNFIFLLTVSVFVLTQAVYIFYLVKYRRRDGVKAHYFHGNTKLEIIWTAIPAAIFIGLVIYSNELWERIHRPPPPNALQVGISSYQFGWDFRYAGADGSLAMPDPEKISMENKFGLAEGDPAAADDFTSAELVIPVGRPVQILLNSRDVIHSFYVPEFRLYQDAVPGRTISWVWFETIRKGEFQLACSQLCGQGHYNMNARIRVVDEAEFEKWYREKSAKAQAAAAPPKIAENPTKTTL